MFRKALEALRKGAARTAAAIGGSLRSLLHGRDLDEALIDEIETALVTADVGVTLARELVDEVRTQFRKGVARKGEDAIGILKARLKARLSGDDLRLARAERAPTVILVVGVNGSGKTTSVAKIAKALRDEGRSVLLAAADTYRAGAVAQLTVWSERLGVDIVKGAAGADPAAVAFDAAEAALARGVDTLLVDTAGRLHTQEGLLRELTKIRNVLAKRIPGAPHETLLVLDATRPERDRAGARVPRGRQRDGRVPRQARRHRAWWRGRRHSRGAWRAGEAGRCRRDARGRAALRSRGLRGCPVLGAGFPLIAPCRAPTMGPWRGAQDSP